MVEFCKKTLLNLAKELDLKGKTTVKSERYNKSGEIENINTISPQSFVPFKVLIKLPSVDPYRLYRPYRLIFHSPFLLTNHLFIIQSLRNLPHILVVNLQKQLSNQRNVQVIKLQSLLLKL